MTEERSRAEMDVRRARTGLLMQQPWFGTLALKLMLIEAKGLCDHSGQPSLGATDGRRLLYNPALLEKLSGPHVKTFVAHEVMHCALHHHTRRGSRDPHIWNLAADTKVNQHLIAAHFEMPEFGYHEPRFDAMSTEEVYEILKQEIRSQGGTGPGANSSRSTGHFTDPTLPDGKPAPESEKQNQEADWKQATAQAAAAAKARGRLPEHIDRLVRESQQPRVDVADALRAFVLRDKVDYSWSKPNRRFISQGLYLPSLDGESLPEGVFAVDTSGSIGQEELDLSADILTGVLEEYPRLVLRVVYCDMVIQHTETFTSDNLPVKLSAKGGGGTAFQPVFDWVEEQGIAPAWLVYLTDLMGDNPMEPDYPVLWACVNDRVAPWGETLHVPVKGRQP